MPLDFGLAPASNDDRDAQLDYIAEDNPVAAVGQGDRIDAQVDTLLRHPLLGRPRRIAGTRELVISRTPFVVVNRIKADRIELLRLLHSSQRWPRD